MDKIQTFEQFLSTQSKTVSISEFGINMVLAVVFAFVLGKVYDKFGNSFSMKESFSRTFVSLTLVTMIVITVVKSSLALSLGLVGALSIVRFRAAIIGYVARL